MSSLKERFEQVLFRSACGLVERYRSGTGMDTCGPIPFQTAVYRNNSTPDVDMVLVIWIILEVISMTTTSDHSRDKGLSLWMICI